MARLLTATLDPGEAEAIALALEIAADLILLDERDGRIAAKAEPAGPGIKNCPEIESSRNGEIGVHNYIAAAGHIKTANSGRCIHGQSSS